MNLAHLFVAELNANIDSDTFINSVTWLYGAEVLPVAIRSRMMGVSAAAHYIINVGCEFPSKQKPLLR